VEPGGELDMQQLLAAAAAMQSQLMNAQQELADAEVEGTAGGGLVTATVNGQGELVDLSISAAAIDAANPDETAQTLSDLVLAAYRDACQGVDDLQEETMGPLAAGLGALPGMPDMSGLAGLTGGVPGLAGGPAAGGQPPYAGYADADDADADEADESDADEGDAADDRDS
jgi:nucleoid-associated protein EbfC